MREKRMVDTSLSETGIELYMNYLKQMFGMKCEKNYDGTYLLCRICFTIERCFEFPL